MHALTNARAHARSDANALAHFSTVETAAATMCTDIIMFRYKMHSILKSHGLWVKQIVDAWK